MKKRKHIFAIIFILFALCISPSFNGGVGKAKNHYSQVVPNENLQYCAVNHKFSFVLSRWKTEQTETRKGYTNKSLCKIDNGNVGIETKPGIRS